MRRALLILGAATLATGTPAIAKPGGGGGGGKPEKHQGGGGGGGHGGGGKAHKAEHRGGGGGRAHSFERRGGGGGGGAYKFERRGGGEMRQARREQRRAERAFARRDDGGRKAERRLQRAERKAEQRSFAKAERKASNRAERRNERFARSERRPEIRSVRYDDRRTDGRHYRYEEPRYADGAGAGAGCPPGLAKKGNGCLPPGQAKKMFAVGQVLPAAFLGGYNVPYEYQDWYQDSPDYQYRYDESGDIFGVNGGSGLVESLIPLLGGSFGVGNILPTGYDAYNLPTSYRDDFVDSDESLYRYGDDAIYQVDPQSQMIEAVVALLGGDLNVGQQLPSGYDAYNLPMEYRDQYQDSDESMYRYADGNIYEVDPQSMIIEQIVAQLT